LVSTMISSAILWLDWDRQSRSMLANDQRSFFKWYILQSSKIYLALTSTILVVIVIGNVIEQITLFLISCQHHDTHHL
jgi:hypothetical protein